MLFYSFLIFGIILIIMGIIFIVKPEILIKSSEITNTVIISDEQIAQYPRILGVFILAASIFILHVSIMY